MFLRGSLIYLAFSAKLLHARVDGPTTMAGSTKVIEKKHQSLTVKILLIDSDCAG